MRCGISDRTAFARSGGRRQTPLGSPSSRGCLKLAEVKAGVVTHAIRVTFNSSQQGYVYPATHSAGSGALGGALPPMGLRLRLKSSFDISGFSGPGKIVAKAMQTYGLILADNGSDWYFQGDSDNGWNDMDVTDTYVGELLTGFRQGERHGLRRARHGRTHEHRGVALLLSLLGSDAFTAAHLAKMRRQARDPRGEPEREVARCAVAAPRGARRAALERRAAQARCAALVWPAVRSPKRRTSRRSTGGRFVVPRFGTISPWSSKATDILRACGSRTRSPHRARGGVDPRGVVDDEGRCARRFSDRMTEAVIAEVGEAAKPVRRPDPRPARHGGRGQGVPRGRERVDGARARGRRDRVPRCAPSRSSGATPPTSSS